MTTNTTTNTNTTNGEVLAELCNALPSVKILQNFAQHVEEGRALSKAQEQVLENIKQNYDTILEAHELVRNSTFIESVYEQFMERGSITARQMECVKSCVKRYLFCRGLLDKVWRDKSPFMESLRKQFEERGSLTDKQCACVHRSIRVYADLDYMIDSTDISDDPEIIAIRELYKNGAQLSPEQMNKLSMYFHAYHE